MAFVPKFSSSHSQSDVLAFRKVYFLLCAAALVYSVSTRFSFTAFAFGEGVRVSYGAFSVADPYVHALIGMVAAAFLVLVAWGRGGSLAVAGALAASLVYFHDSAQLRSVGFLNRLGRENCLFLALLVLHLMRPKGKREHEL